MDGNRFALIVIVAIALEMNGAAVLAAGQTTGQTGPTASQTAAGKDQATAASSGADLARKATDPSSILTQLQFQNIFVPSSNDADGLKADGYANTFIIQPVIPFAAGDGFPLDLVIRPTLPIVTTPDIKIKSTGQTIVSDTTQLGDLSVLAPLFKREKWGTWGGGLAMTFPTATDKRTGASKWQVGPVAAVINNSIDKWTLGALTWNQTSFASTRSGQEDVNKLFFQPVVVRHFSEGWYAGWGDLPFTFNWKRDGKAEIPINLRIGKVQKFGDLPMNIFFEPFYTIDHEGLGSPSWGAKINVTLLFPELKWQF